MIILSIGTDRKIFEPGSASRARMIEYGRLCTELHIILFTKEGNFQAEKISDNVWIYPTLSKKRWKYPFDARKVFKTHLQNVKPDIITTQDPFETALAGWLIRMKHKAKFHIQIHTDFLSPYFKKGSWLNRVRVALAYFLLPKADAVRAVSKRISDSLVKIREDLPAKTTVLPIYTDISKFKDATISKDLHRQYPQFGFIILMASRLTSEKNIAFALSVMKEVVVKHKEAGLVIVGEGPEKKYLQAVALKYHLDRNVVFESWQDDLASYYRTADVFLTTSLYEGYGLTLVEAAASGCPIVSSDVGIAKNLIQEGKTGFVLDVSDKAPFVEKILKLIEQFGLKEQMREAARDAAAHTVSESKEAYLKKYQAFLS